MDFPQYYNSFHGKTVAKLLRGEFGNIEQVSPYLASLAYALDRASVKQEMEDFLKTGGIIISNRYATSNMAHQGAKFKNHEEKEEFLKWVYDLEYKIHRIPKETIVLYLYVPWKIGLTLTKNKGKRDYLKGQDKDIHEKDENHLRDAETMYLSLSKKYKHWITISCLQNGKLLSPEIIHDNIISVLHEKKILKEE
jgi:dTMP kinase